jgi:hypothetical protein
MYYRQSRKRYAVASKNFKGQENFPASLRPKEDRWTDAFSDGQTCQEVAGEKQ